MILVSTALLINLQASKIYSLSKVNKIIMSLEGFKYLYPSNT